MSVSEKGTTSQVMCVENIEEGELEDGEIKDDTGQEDLGKADYLCATATRPTTTSTSTSTRPATSTSNLSQSRTQTRSRPRPKPTCYIPPLMSVNFSLPPAVQGNSPHASIKVVNSEIPVNKQLEHSSTCTSSKHYLESQDVGIKRRCVINKDADVVWKDKTDLKRGLKTKRSKQRSVRKMYVPRSHNFQPQRNNLPPDEEAFETLLRKHHEVQELIKQQKEKLTSETKFKKNKFREQDTNDPVNNKAIKREKSHRLSRPCHSLANEKIQPTVDLDINVLDTEDVVEASASPVEVIEIVDDESDDEEDELLHLRRLALESATKNVAAKEEKEKGDSTREQKGHQFKAKQPTSAHSDTKRAKQRERRQKVQQLFQQQSLTAEICKVHGEKERFSGFMDYVMRKRRRSSSPGRSFKRSPSVTRECPKTPILPPDGATAEPVFPPTGVGIFQEVEADNYEEVGMDVSEVEESPVSSPNAAVHVSEDHLQSNLTDPSRQVTSDAATDSAKDEDDDEEDVMALREQLLRSLATKRATKSQIRAEEYVPDGPTTTIYNPSYEPSRINLSQISVPSPLQISSPKVPSPLLTPQNHSSVPSYSISVKTTAVKTKQKTLVPVIPTHKPVIIQFGDDSDSSEDDSPQKHSVSQINSLDLFLKEARRTADARRSRSKLNPHVRSSSHAMHKLPAIHQAEYQQLKEEIARREQQQQCSDKMVALKAGNTSGKESPIRDVTVSIIQVGGKVQRKVVLKELPSKECDQSSSTTKSRSAVTVSQENEQFLEYNDKLRKHTIAAEKDCRILNALQKQLIKRHSILKQMEIRLQQLRDELDVGENIATSHRSAIKKYIQHKRLIQNKVQEHVTIETKLRNNLAKAKGVSIDDVHPSPLLCQVASAIPRKTTVPVGKQQRKKPPTSGPIKKANSSLESKLEHLQNLEREYAEKISQLRRVNVNHPTVTAKPVSKTVRILQTRTKLLNKKPSIQLLMKDKIVLGGDSSANTDNENDAGKHLKMTCKDDSQQRRCSFLDDNPSLRPNLSTDPPQNQNGVNQNHKPVVATAGHPRTIVGKQTDSLDKTADPANTPTTKTSHVESKAASKKQNTQVEVVEGLSMPGNDQVKRLRCAHAEKLKTVLDFSSITKQLGLNNSDCLSIALKPEDKMTMTEDFLAEEEENVAIENTSLTLYVSPLLHFRSYRLSPFFVKESKMSRLSVSVSHKMDPMKVLCKFELNGTCNDDDCPWQHKSDYELTNDEVFADILSYAPLIGNSKEWSNATKRGQRVAEYIYKAVKKSKNPTQARRQGEALCRAFSNAVLAQINKNEDSSGVVVMEPRRWTLRDVRSDQPPQDDVDDEDPHVVPCGNGIANLLPLYMEGLGRYYDRDSIDELEAGVVDYPGDVTMWIKLAGRLIGEDCETPDVDRGLNALSRGLEANQSSSALWIQYLTLYSKRDDSTDLQELYQQATQFAPSYDLYWLCLGLEESFTAKDTICKKMIGYFQCQQLSTMTVKGSHWLLEALLYRVQLYMVTRRVKAGMTVLQNVLREAGSMVQCLTSDDLYFAWLVHIHIIAYQCLPAQLFNPTGPVPSHVVSKKVSIFQWDCPCQSADAVRAAFKEAIEMCKHRDQTVDNQTCKINPLQKSAIMFEQKSGRHDTAVEMCQKLLDKYPTNSGACTLLMTVHAYQGTSINQVEPLIQVALRDRPMDAELYNTIVKITLRDNNPMAAVGILKLCALSYCQTPTHNDVDMVHNVYLCLLGQSLPFDSSRPKLLPGATPAILQKQVSYLYLNYCLLQQLTADEGVASEMYEKLLCHVRSSEDARQLWMAYLVFKKSKLISAPDRVGAFRTFTTLIKRCLVSMSTRFLLPYSQNKTWLDYSFHDHVAEMYVTCLKDNQQLDMYERLIAQMPENIPLAFRACQHGSKLLSTERGVLPRIKAIATEILHKHPHCLPFWKILIALSLHEGRLKEAMMLYHQALDEIPLTANLWKDLLLLQVAQGGQTEHVRKLVLRCRQLNVNIEDYLQTILK